ncbi:MAG: helicase-related protein [Candidatus Lokiarchaeota archaeon]
MTIRTINSEEVVPKYDIGEVVKARDRLWRIDNRKIEQKEINGKIKEYILYFVSNITGQPSSQILIPDIEPIEEATLPKPSTEEIGSPIYQRLLLDAMKLDLIYGTTSFISLQNSKVIPVSYQMVPVLMALNLKNVRLLLADDIGLGKTIEAGLIMQELLGRKRINRVLMVVPANLREQWQTILKRFFAIDAVIMSRRNRRRLESELLVGGNPWGYYNFIIVSVDYAKRPEVKEEIIQFHWDMIIIDEAHNVMRPHLGNEDETSKSFKQSYGFAKILAENYSHLLLLTATPHNGYKDSFCSLLEMINPKLISREDSHDYIINRDLAINHICQRRRQDVEEWISGSKYNKNPFPKRDADEIYITPSQQFELNIWTILHFHKRAISSPHALICSVESRIKEIDKKLNKNYQAIQDTKSYLSSQEAAQSVMDGYETDRLSEDELDLRTDKLILTKTMEDLGEEKSLLKEVKKTSIELKKKDTKMIDLIDRILPNRFKITKKIIIFTRYIDTLTYIKENLLKAKERYSQRYGNVEIFSVHGRMASQHRQDVYNDFLKSKAGILISTDCMAEGIDLQFSADQVINYELTWNPNRLEQRNGRIDRFGQPKETVYIRTLIMKNTLEMDILETLVKKAYEIKKAYGFVPGFFGDPEAVVDHIRAKRQEEKRQDTQTTLDKWINFSSNVEDLISVFFSEQKVKEMVEDSFYGHNNINLKEIEERMRLTEESIGNEETLLDFLKRSVNLYEGKIQLENEHMQTYEVKLPDKIQKDIGVDLGERYIITPNRELNSSRSDIEGVNLKNPLISGLVEKIKNEAFSIENEFYGRIAAFKSQVIPKVAALFHIKIRYIINTEPKMLMEEITNFGVDLFGKNRLDDKEVEKVWNSEPKNHGKIDLELKKHLKQALELPNLDHILDQISKEHRDKIIQERRTMIENLKEQGIATDLKGIDDIDIVGKDLITLTLVYPEVNSNI